MEELALQHYASPEGGGWQGMHRYGFCTGEATRPLLLLPYCCCYLVVATYHWPCTAE